MKLRFVVSHPFRKEREMDGAPRVCGYMSEKQTRVLRLPPQRRRPVAGDPGSLRSLRMTDLFEYDSVAAGWMTEFC
jgi:hypothetical protein